MAKLGFLEIYDNGKSYQCSECKKGWKHVYAFCAECGTKFLNYDYCKELEERK